MYQVFLGGRRRTPLCEACHERWSLRSDLMPRMRALTEQEARAAWSGVYSQVDYAEYVAHVKAMRSGESYELLPDDGVSPASTRRRYSHAAQQAGRRLVWAPIKKTGGKLIARLEDASPNRNGVAQPKPHALVARSAF
jgi:hypothetical protein